MNRLDKIALAAVVITTLLYGRATVNIAGLYADLVTRSSLLIGITGWFLTTYGPIGFAVCFWRWSKRVRAPWLMHLLFLFCAVAAFRLGGTLMLFGSGDPDFDSALGYATLQSVLLFLIALLLYLAAVLSRLKHVDAAEPNPPG